jgi:hypothetical protein
LGKRRGGEKEDTAEGEQNMIERTR